ncbi:MAG: hypothetical protein ACTS3F_01185 [Phycisphaerales bacterium]
MGRGERASLVVWIDERRVGAAVVVPGERARIVRAADLPVRGDLLGWMDAPEKAAELGRSLRAAMHDAGIRGREFGGRAIGVVSRQCIVLKRLRFEGKVDVQRDLPGMVRLQFVRQLALPLEGAAIDYTMHEGSSGGEGEHAGTGQVAGGAGASGGSGGLGGVGVVAAAMIGQRLECVRALVKGAGLKLRHLGVSPTGLAALASPALASADGPVLAVVPTRTGADYLIVDRGCLTFARTIELSMPHDAGHDSMVGEGGGSAVGGGGDAGAPAEERAALRVDLLATEAKRTWVSERLSASAEPVCAAMALVPAWVSGDDRVALADRCAGELGLPCSSAALSDLVDIAGAGVGDGTASWLFAAAGVAQGRHLNLEAIDLLRVRKPPDENAKWRKLAMAAALLIVAGVGVGYTVLSSELRALETQRDLLSERLRPQRERLGGAMQTQVQLAHLRRWESTGVDWLGHLDAITGSLPGRESLLLSDLTLAGAAELIYEPGRGARGAYDPSIWSSRVSLSGTIIGRASGTRVVDGWRGRLVGDALYTVAPVGRDLPGSSDERYPVPVALRLVSSVPSPPPAAPRGGNGGGGGEDSTSGEAVAVDGGVDR